MDVEGSVPELLLPPHLALQNPELVGGHSFYIFAELGQILVMLDNDGDENYQPMVIPLAGGFPELAFGDILSPYRVSCSVCDAERGLIYMTAQARQGQYSVLYRGDMITRTVERLHVSHHLCAVIKI